MALTRKEILTYLMTWMNTEDILLSEISQTIKGQTLRDLLIRVRYLEVKFTETESEW